MNTRIYDLKTEYEQGLNEAARVVAKGGLVVMPTETVYGLGANAADPHAVRHIFEVKGRPQDNPLIVHICDISQAWIAAREISPLAERLMRRFWPGPFTAVLKKSRLIPDVVSAGLETVGVRLPALECARELIRRSGCMIAAPSANLSGRPSPTRAAHVIRDLYGRVPVILDGGESGVGVESTVCDLTGEVPVILRPGGITAEMIKEEAGDVRIAHAVLNGLAEGEKAASPGMKYKHYSPKAKVTVVEAENADKLANELNLLYDKNVCQGRRTLILCASDVAGLLGEREHKCMGDTPEQIAHSMFDELRLADENGIDEILFEATGTEGMGLAVMNRVIRAAGFDVIKV